jgi:hypothetical protein
MKYSFLLSILIITQNFIEVTWVVNFKDYSSDEKTLDTNTYNDLLGISVECPFKGALKNFVIKKNGDKIRFDYSCYSSLTDSNEYDESILKGLYASYTYIFKYKTTDQINSFGKIDIRCPIDYALNKFIISKDTNTFLNIEYSCVGVKSSYQTKYNTITSGTNQGSKNSLDSVIGVTCGDITIETDQVPGTPLRGFQYIITDINNSNVKAYCSYSYHKLRSIALEKKEWAKNTADLRNKNTQTN